MDSLVKICEVLALKRSLAEREIARSKLLLKDIDAQLEVLQEEIASSGRRISSGRISETPIVDAFRLEQWRDAAVGKVQKLQTERLQILERFEAKNKILKEMVVKEALVNRKLKAKQRADELERLNQDSSSRLHNWIISRHLSL